MLSEEELEQYKKDCEYALTCLSYDGYGHFIEGLRSQINLLERLINEYFELKETNILMSEWNKKLHNIIDILQYNPPLKFEELRPNMWIWDNKYKEYIPIDNVNVEKRIFNEWEYIDHWGESDYDYVKFEENRFYERQVKKDE